MTQGEAKRAELERKYPEHRGEKGQRVLVLRHRVTALHCGYLSGHSKKDLTQPGKWYFFAPLLLPDPFGPNDER